MQSFQQEEAGGLLVQLPATGDSGPDSARDHDGPNDECDRCWFHTSDSLSCSPFFFFASFVVPLLTLRPTEGTTAFQQSHDLVVLQKEAETGATHDDVHVRHQVTIVGVS